MSQVKSLEGKNRLCSFKYVFSSYTSGVKVDFRKNCYFTVKTMPCRAWHFFFRLPMRGKNEKSGHFRSYSSLRAGQSRAARPLLTDWDPVTSICEVTIALYPSQCHRIKIQRTRLNQNLNSNFKLFRKNWKKYSKSHIIHLVFWESYVLFR
jgi:hypothetical protein